MKNRRHNWATYLIRGLNYLGGFDRFDAERITTIPYDSDTIQVHIYQDDTDCYTIEESVDGLYTCCIGNDHIRSADFDLVRKWVLTIIKETV